MENKNKKGYFFQKELKPFTFKNKNSTITLEFQDRTNTNYKIIKQKDEYIPETENYADLIRRHLNPNIENNNHVFGIAKTLEPKTTIINKMKDTINKANESLIELINKAPEQVEQTQTEQTKGEIPTNDKHE